MFAFDVCMFKSKTKKIVKRHLNINHGSCQECFMCKKQKISSVDYFKDHKFFGKDETEQVLFVTRYKVLLPEGWMLKS